MSDSERRSVAPGRLRQMEIYVTGAGGARPSVPIRPAALEAKAASAMSAQAAAYIIGGAGGEATMSANRGAFDRYRLVPRVLQNVSKRDLTVRL
ncbi:MAG: alpha-hydroxy-acid oxidizing protein, partial [Rhizobiaceae bacterium]